MDCICARRTGIEMITCSNPKAQYLSYKNEIDSAISRVLSSGRYILGREVRSFEQEFSSYIGVSYGIGVGNGTEALHLALRACEIGENDEVITVSHTAVATVAAIKMSGAKPVFVDIEPNYFTIDVTQIEDVITPKSKAIIPVHIYGHPADMKSVMAIARKYRLKVIEDCSQAHGAKIKDSFVGSFGDMACFSFYPTKNLGALGDGGIILTNNKELAIKVKLMREYGWEERNVSSFQGFNSRLDEIQAAILRIKLKYLDEDSHKRRLIAKNYNFKLKQSDLILPKKRKDILHVYHLYVVRSKKRNELENFLKNRNIIPLIHYPTPVHLQPAYLNNSSIVLPETERAAKEILSLPIYPEITNNELKEIIKSIKEILK